MDTTTKLTQVEINLLLEEKEKKHFQSSYSFLNDHNGFRPGNLHLMLGVTSGGKSTFVRSLIIDILCNKPKKNILLWLSEETRLEFLTEFSYSSFNDFNNENFFIISEVDLGEMSKEDLIKKMEEIVFENDIDIVICDNLTTSDIYMDKGVEAQSEMAKQLKKMAVAWNIPLLVFMHTKAEITENYNNIINMNDVRGSKSIIALAQFLYILQNFMIDSERLSTLRTLKNRGYIIKDTSIYRLLFSPKARLIVKSTAIPFSEFKEAFKMRNKL